MQFNKQSTSNKRSYSPVAIRRIVADLGIFNASKPHGIFIHSDEEDIGRHLVLIIGPEKTPYEDGFFFFEMLFPEDYPFSPPKVEIRTTNPEYRFNPNYYIDGKVCLSILGTWTGPSWEPTMNIDTVLISVQTRMNELPLENEPGWDNVPMQQKLTYNHIIRDLTLRYSVLHQLSNNFPNPQINDYMSFEVFRPVVLDYFQKRYENYFKLIDTIPNTILSSRFGPYSRMPDKEKLISDFKSLLKTLEEPKILPSGSLLPSGLQKEEVKKRHKNIQLKLIVPFTIKVILL